MNSGWIKIHRKLLEWEWWDDPNVFRVFFFLLLSTNHLTKQWKGKTILKGQMLTSIATIAQQTKLTPQMVRTALNKLKVTGEITNHSTSQYRIITINNWEKYQVVTNELTNKQQTANKRATNEVTTNKNNKNEKNDKKTDYGEFSNVKLTPEEYMKLIDVMGEDNVQGLIFELDTYLESTGKRYKSHYATLLSWARRKSTESRRKKKLII